MMLKSDADIGLTNNSKNWTLQVKVLLQDLGLHDIWLNQQTQQIPFTLIKQRIYDMHNQTWYADVRNSPKLDSYCRYKHECLFESYLENIPVKKYRIALSKIRLSSHDLAIETGRYENTPREHRLCLFCNMNMIESEYHFILVCPFYIDIRKKYFKTYYNRWPTLQKFELLMSSNSKSTQINLSKYIYFAMKRRNM